jgi:hypothetical protein
MWRGGMSGPALISLLAASTTLKRSSIPLCQFGDDPAAPKDRPHVQIERNEHLPNTGICRHGILETMIDQLPHSTLLNSRPS